MISIKRAATIGATAAILLGTAMPAFAGQRYNRSNDELDVNQHNSAVIINDVDTKADTGDNSVSGGSKWGRGSVIRTGDATAVGTVQTLVNRNVAVVN